jgi:long-subunit fatty acid transport protein
MLTATLLAGGIVTNQNQSAQYTRMQARDATLGIDAVFFNPAGLNLLENNGLHLSINNQTLGQTRTITSDYPNLNQSEYVGTVSAPFFPGFYAAYKLDNWAFSFGFNPIGGGGGGIYEDGLPSFEYGISDLSPTLAAQGQPAQGYSMDAYFEGTSIFFGYQANISYKINEMISVAIGARYVSAKETYNGYLKDISVDMAGTLTPASTIMTNAADLFRPGMTATSDVVSAGYGDLTFAEAEAATIITATQRAQLEGGITALGLDPTSMAISTASAIYTGAVNKYDGTATILQDQEVEYEKTATGITPIVSVNIKASDKLNIALKYEHHTKLEFTNKTSKDFLIGFEDDGTPITQFPDGAKSRLDIPSLLMLGATFEPSDKLLISTGFHYYFDKSAEYGRTYTDENDETQTYDNADIMDNTWEFALGVEYNITEKFLASAGWLIAQSGVTEDYQSDLSYSLPSNTFGGGVAYKFSPLVEVNLAGSYSIYKKGSKSFDYTDQLEVTTPITETYIKDVWIVALGVNLTFGAGK